MKIIFYEKTTEDEAGLRELISGNDALKGAEVEFVSGKIDESNIALAHNADVLGVFVNSEVRQAQIDQLPNLKLIVTLSTGFDHIDIGYAKSKNITVCNVPGYGSRTVAEFTFALMLGLTRKAFAAYRQVKDNHDFSIANFEGFNLQGKTLGIVGTGRIGQNVAKIAKGFEMNLLAFDAFPNETAAAEIGFKYVSLDELLSSSDIVTLHVPYNKDTHHLINSTNIVKFKKGSILINTSRGEVAETDALLHGLDQEILSGLGIDVIEGERALIDEWKILAGGKETPEQQRILAEDNALINHPKVVYTPHIAFYTKEAKREILQTTVSNIEGFVGGKSQNVIL